jgi:hypothetical protein
LHFSLPRGNRRNPPVLVWRNSCIVLDRRTLRHVDVACVHSNYMCGQEGGIKIKGAMGVGQGDEKWGS